MYLLALSGLFICFGMSLVATSLGPTRFLGIPLKGGWDRALIALGVVLTAANLIEPDISLGFRANPYWALGITAALALAAFCIRIYRINKGEDDGRPDAM
jgi:hypothetical protein